jgi:hypothetical protein
MSETKHDSTRDEAEAGCDIHENEPRPSTQTRANGCAPTPVGAGINPSLPALKGRLPKFHDKERRAQPNALKFAPKTKLHDKARGTEVHTLD